MGGTTAIGILADDGRVPYYLVGDYVSMMEILDMPYDEHVGKFDIICKSVEDFFLEEYFEEEDSVGRYLIMKDGSMLFQLSWDTTRYRLAKAE
jgi:hypothetical protein